MQAFSACTLFEPLTTLSAKSQFNFILANINTVCAYPLIQMCSFTFTAIAED